MALPPALISNVDNEIIDNKFNRLVFLLLRVRRLINKSRAHIPGAYLREHGKLTRNKIGNPSQQQSYMGTFFFSISVSLSLSLPDIFGKINGS